MRAMLGVLSLLVALAIVAMLAKKQTGVLSASPDANVPQQSQQIQQQVRQSVENAMQQARPMPDDK